VSVDSRAGERTATLGDVFASREYRFLLSANAFSWIGDYLARAAVTALIFHDTGSAALSAAAFALSYLPWLAGGPVLAAVAERRAFRSVMVTCDLIRMVLIVLVAVPRLPVWAMLGLLFGTALLNPPFQAARSALLPQVLMGDRFVVGLALQQSTGQAAQVIGFAAGAALAGFYPRLALVVNAATFGLSALLIRLGVRDRRPIDLPEERRNILRETADGYQIIFRSPIMRTISLVVVATMFFGVVPEGLAAAWAAELSDTRAHAGWVQALIMVANPIGFIIGGLVIGRLIRPALRRRLVPLFAVLVPLALVPALLSPPVFVIALMAATCGFAIAGMFPAANGIFVQVLPPGYRARAFGVMQSGVQLAQGVGVLATGVLADRFALPTVVGAWSIVGVVVVLVMVLQWPAGATIDAAVGAGQDANSPTAAEPGRPAGRYASTS
jgi:predicted MFS family arabinose efflux permease